MKRVTIVDYGMGNVRSLTRALERAGAAVDRAATPQAIASAERLVVPGQGAFGQAMGRLAEAGLKDALRAAANAGRPFLGICLGLQILYASSEEAPGIPGLGLLPGRVGLLPVGAGLKRPHMGWAPVTYEGNHPVLAANPSSAAFYFVHSYAATTAEGCEIAWAEQGVPFVAALAKDNLVATQFHPEKSQDAGARLIRTWLSL